MEKSKWVKIDASTHVLVIQDGVFDLSRLVEYAKVNHKTEMRLVLNRLNYRVYEANISENNKKIQSILDDIQNFVEKCRES